MRSGASQFARGVNLFGPNWDWMQAVRSFEVWDAIRGSELGLEDRGKSEWLSEGLKMAKIPKKHRKTHKITPSSIQFEFQQPPEPSAAPPAPLLAFSQSQRFPSTLCTSLLLSHYNPRPQKMKILSIFSSVCFCLLVQPAKKK